MSVDRIHKFLVNGIALNNLRNRNSFDYISLGPQNILWVAGSEGDDLEDLLVVWFDLSGMIPYLRLFPLFNNLKLGLMKSGLGYTPYSAPGQSLGGAPVFDLVHNNSLLYVSQQFLLPAINLYLMNGTFNHC